MPDPHLIVRAADQRNRISTSGGERLIFVGGPPRSGTTLVQNMLDSHPDISGGPELFCVSDVVYLRRKLHKLLEKGWIDVFFTGGEVDQKLSLFLQNLLLPFGEKNGASHVSEKTPANIFVFSDLLDFVEGAHFINVIRDPRAITSSMLAVGRRGKNEGWKTQDFTRSVSCAIRNITESYDAGYAAFKKAPSRVLNVVYERLVSEPEMESKRICDFLAVEWSRDMTRPGRVSHSGENAITNNVWYTKDMYNRDPVTSEIDKWKHDLSQLQRMRISNAFKSYGPLREFGYDFSTNDLPLYLRAMDPAIALGQRMLETLQLASKGFGRRVLSRS